ncbi:CBS-domain-containing protein [Backusella circina FSU 941]|nr:CBS-domain-containing protein [Backusella circina FSU 941]
MAAKRSDCVLVVDDEEHLSGIFTAKDLAYRVVADNLDARATTVADIMTKNPMCVTADTSAQDALNLMVSRGFRHLPVCNEEGDIFGLLDITKCIYEALNKMERAYGSSRKLYDALEGVEREWANSPVQFVQYMEALRDKMSCPDLTTVLDHAGPVQVPVKAQVREVAKLMKEYHTTAVLVMDHGGLAGIFTSKDIVLRVIAAGLAPDSCSVVRVMTPHPDTALPSTSILDALKKMNDGHYLNLPVVDEDKNIVGLIDVLRLTYVTLEQINSIEGNQSDGGKFWNSITAGESTETDSVISDSLSQAANSHMFQSSTSPIPHHQPPHHSISAERSGSVTSPLPGHAPTYTGLGYAEITPGDSISVVDNTSTVSSHVNGTFSFKFNYGSKTHRFRHDGSNFKSLKEVIQQKIMVEHLSLSQSYVNVQGENEEEGEDWLTIAYLDDEDDQVLMTSDADLADSIQLARKSGLDRVRLFVHDAVAEAVAAAEQKEKELMMSQSVSALQQIPASQPTTEGYKMETSMEVSKENLQELSDDEQEVEEDKTKSKKKGTTRDISNEYNLPIPQEMLLPAAITFLGVVILGVFTISKLTSNNSRY